MIKPGAKTGSASGEENHDPDAHEMNTTGFSKNEYVA